MIKSISINHLVGDHISISFLILKEMLRNYVDWEQEGTRKELFVLDVYDVFVCVFLMWLDFYVDSSEGNPSTFGRKRCSRSCEDGFR